MSQDWIVNVLQDLRKFARKNGFAELAEQLDDTIHIAVAETTEKAHRDAVTDIHANSSRGVSGARRVL